MMSQRFYRFSTASRVGARKLVPMQFLPISCNIDVAIKITCEAQSLQYAMPVTDLEASRHRDSVFETFQKRSNASNPPHSPVSVALSCFENPCSISKNTTSCKVCRVTVPLGPHGSGLKGYLPTAPFSAP